MTSSNGSIFRVTGPFCGEFTGPGEFPAQRPVTRSFNVFFDLCLNKRLRKQPWGWWFETPSWSLWRHRNVQGQFWPKGIVITCIWVFIGLCVSRSQVCLRDNLWPVQVRITKFGPKVQSTLVKVPIVLGVIDLDLEGQISLQSQIPPNSWL